MQSECTCCVRMTPLFAKLRGWGEFKDASALSRHQLGRVWLCPQHLAHARRDMSL